MLVGQSQGVRGGHSVAIQKVPWVVLVTYDARSPKRLTRCSGSIINRSHVVTAAHCVIGANGVPAKPSDVDIVAGTSDYRPPRTLGATQRRVVAAIYIPPHYTYEELPFDIAVLRLTAPLNLGKGGVNAIKLPALHQRFSSPDELAGFGRENPRIPPNGIISRMTVVIASHHACGTLLILCASSKEAASCDGDSGAGLVSIVHPTLLGVLVAGSGAGCRPGSYSLYTSVQDRSVLVFIRRVTRPSRWVRH